MLAQSFDNHASTSRRAGTTRNPNSVDGQIMDPRPRTPTAPSAMTLIAHDLRGPLTSLRLLVELIETCGARQQPERIAKHASRAGAIIDGLDDMLNSLLQRVLTTGDPLGYEPQDVDLDRIMRRAAAMALPMAEGKNVHLHAQSATSVKVRGDGQLLHQAIENLIGNAVKYSGPGMSVRCSLRQIGETAVFSVEDTGAGLTSRDINNAFRPFTKLSSKSSDKNKSWGLGLWIVKLIAERHNGTATVTSGGPGQGATFSIRLPLIC